MFSLDVLHGVCVCVSCYQQMQSHLLAGFFLITVFYIRQQAGATNHLQLDTAPGPWGLSRGLGLSYISITYMYVAIYVCSHFH